LKQENGGRAFTTSRLNDQAGYLVFSEAMRKVMRPSSGTVSSWLLKPLPLACQSERPRGVTGKVIYGDGQTEPQTKHHLACCTRKSPPMFFSTATGI
jgi:hypothetical protein